MTEGLGKVGMEDNEETKAGGGAPDKQRGTGMDAGM